MARMALDAGRRERADALRRHGLRKLVTRQVFPAQQMEREALLPGVSP